MRDIKTMFDKYHIKTMSVKYHIKSNSKNPITIYGILNLYVCQI